MPSPISIKFDFRHYLPDQDLNAGTVQLDSTNCAGDGFIVALLAQNLIPGHAYRTTYELVSPATTQNVFNPSVSDLYASFSTQNLVTSAKLPFASINTVNNYILKATIRDITEGTTATASTQINLICGLDKPTFRLEILDPDLQPLPPDNVIDVGSCANTFPLVSVIRDAVIGRQYDYEFFDNPAGGLVFDNKRGTVYAGDVNQNINSQVALTGYPYVFVHSKATEISTGIVRYSQPVLLKCYQTNPCDVVLPTGVDCVVGDIPVFKKCSKRGLTIDSISSLYGGQGFSIGDTLTTTGGGGYGTQIEILSGGITQSTISSLVGGSGFNINDFIEITGGGGKDGLIKLTSGGITNNSITSLTGCAGFNIGDLLTTIGGGGGKDALISVTATGVNGSILSYNVINPGYGYTNTPTSVTSIAGNGSCATAIFNADNFSIPCKGAITNDSINLYGGNGYNIGEILNVVGGGGEGAQVKVLTGSLTPTSITLSGGTGYQVGDLLSTLGGGGSDTVIQIASTGVSGAISSFEIINPGYGFTSAPTGISNILGTGISPSFGGNANNFSITSKGSITKASISGLTNSSNGFTIGDRLIVVGGGGTGGVIQVTSTTNGVITGYEVLNGGSGYYSAPQLFGENQQPISSQPTWNISRYTKNSYIVITQGCGYVGEPAGVISSNGDGSGLSSSFDFNKYSGYAYIVINSGSGYTTAPTGFVVKSGNGSGATASFNDDNFTIPCEGGITYNSVIGLIGKSTFTMGEELIAEGGGGSGGRIKITETNNGSVVSFVVLNAGCGYTSSPTLTKLGGDTIAGVSFNANNFTDLAIVLTDPGYGFTDSPSGLQTLTGTGQTDSIYVEFNNNNFLEIVGPEPSPSPTPTPTITPSASEAVRCNSLQSAGGVNTITFTNTIQDAVSGQNYVIVENVPGLDVYSVVLANGIPRGSHVTKIENFFANFNDRIVYKKITLNNSLTENIPLGRQVTVYVTDVRLIKVPYWPGTMTFRYDAYAVPDRFMVFSVPLDSRRPEVLLHDTWYRGQGYSFPELSVSGVGSGVVQIDKPDGSIYVKVVVDAPLEGTAWEYSLECPIRTFTTITPTPSPTLTVTPTKTLTPTPTPTVTPSSGV